MSEGDVEFGDLADKGASKQLPRQTCTRCEADALEIRHEQRQIASRIAGLECDYVEHRMVLESLANVDPKRKCFKVTGGVLVQMTVEEMLPTLTKNKDLLSKTIDHLMETLNEKSKEMLECQEKNGTQHEHVDKKPNTWTSSGAGEYSEENNDDNILLQ